MNHDVEDSINPYTIPFVNRYVTCPRLDRGIPIPCLVSLPASHFTRTVMHDPMINHLITLSSLWWCITEWAQRYLCVIWSDKSQSRFVPTQQTLSEIPVVHLYSHPVTLWRFDTPKAFLRYPGVAQSHGLRKWYLTSRKATANELHDLCAMLRFGSCPSHHSPNDVIPLSMTSRCP